MIDSGKKTVPKPANPTMIPGRIRKGRFLGERKEIMLTITTQINPVSAISPKLDPPVDRGISCAV